MRAVPRSTPPPLRRIVSRVLSTLAILVAWAAPSAAQTAMEGGGTAFRAASAAGVRSIRAASASEIVLDGRLDEDAWAAAEPATSFSQRRPDPGSAASQLTEARLLYAEDALYVGMRLHDTAPDSVTAPLARRDFDGQSDWAHVLIDSYHDRRTAFRFAVNPAGVKSDAMISGDAEGNEDSGWDPVWDVAVSRDAGGWQAEMRIPLTQLRFTAAEGGGVVWGIQFMRDLARRGERSLWAPAAPDAPGFVSRFGEVSQLRVSPPARFELVPYAVGRLTRAPGDAGDPLHRSNDVIGSLGADLRLGLSPEITLTATLRPDFGQLEADPSEVNLTATESFLSERRPFFIEGGDIFRSGYGIAPWVHGPQELFYSRRIGRAPRGRAPEHALFSDAPEAATLLGAVKLSGKTRGGWSVGLLDAVTAREDALFVDAGGARGRAPVEPMTNFLVARAIRDFDEGDGAIGGLFTATHRRLVEGLDFLPSAGYVGAVDARRRFGGGSWEVEGSLSGSLVTGSAGAVDEIARGPVHRLQRPDADHLGYDPGATELWGSSGSLVLRKVAGGRWRFGLGGQAITPGFEANDLGFQTQSDVLRAHSWLGYRYLQPSRHLRSWESWLNAWSGWSFGGERIQTGAAWFVGGQLHNYLQFGAELGHSASALAPGELRGGPALLDPGRTRGSIRVGGDPRRALIPRFGGSFRLDHGTGGSGLRLDPELALRPSARAELMVRPSIAWNRNPTQYVTSADALGATEYVVGDLSQTTVSLVTRASYTFTPDLSLQVYAQPFISAGEYGAFRRVRDPRAEAFGSRFAPLEDLARQDGHLLSDLNGDGAADLRFDDPAFNVREIDANAVLRWEYRPGSTLFLVWSHSRSGSEATGPLDLFGDVDRLAGLAPTNTLQVKLSHWIG